MSWVTRLCFYQTRSAWSMDQGSTRKRSAVHNFDPTVTKFCVMWEGLSLPHDTKFRNCRGEIVDRTMIFIWSLIHGSGWSGFIKAEPGHQPPSYWPGLLGIIRASTVRDKCSNHNWHDGNIAQFIYNLSLSLVISLSGPLGVQWGISRHICEPKGIARNLVEEHIWILTKKTKYTVHCNFNTFCFLENPHHRYPIACPLGWDMGCLF